MDAAFEESDADDLAAAYRPQCSVPRFVAGAQRPAVESSARTPSSLCGGALAPSCTCLLQARAAPSCSSCVLCRHWCAARSALLYLPINQSLLRKKLSRKLLVNFFNNNAGNSWWSCTYRYEPPCMGFGLARSAILIVCLSSWCHRKYEIVAYVPPHVFAW